MGSIYKILKVLLGRAIRSFQAGSSRMLRNICYIFYPNYKKMKHLNKFINALNFNKSPNYNAPSAKSINLMKTML